jgi:GTP cyclohydrolase II
MSNTTPVIHMPNHNPALTRGRLIFALDATASREPTWGVARDLQAKMFREAAPVGKLLVQLVFYGGDSCGASKWCQSGKQLASLMNKIACQAGETQIGRVLDHVLREHKTAPVQAVTFIGDAMEEELDPLTGLAGKLGWAGVLIYLFQEGRDPVVRKAFQLLALKSGGAWFEFNPDKPRAVDKLSEQLNAIARLAVGDQTMRRLLTNEPPKPTNERNAS